MWKGVLAVSATSPIDTCPCTHVPSSLLETLIQI